MKTFLFHDEATGEEFFVEANTKETAIERAKQYFDEPSFDAEVDEEFAEMVGLDTY